MTKTFNDIKSAVNLNLTPRLTTGSVNLDKALCGGLLTSGITEIFGESGSGKSQLCMQLSLTAQLPVSLGGLNSCVIYICSEEHFQSKRLHQLISNFSIKMNLENTINFSNNIYVSHATDYQSLENLFDQILQLVKNKKVKLLILDSIAGIFRGSLLDCDGHQKAKELRKIVKFFYSLCDNHNITIICTNQITQSVESDKIIPALGLVWSNLINTRIQLKKNLFSRSLKVIFSPAISSVEVNFTINECGVNVLSDI